MDVKLEKWGEDFALPLPIELIEKFGLKEGDCLELSDDALRKLFGKSFDSKQPAGEK